MANLDDMKFDYTTIGDPVSVGDRTIRAVARISGLKSPLQSKSDSESLETGAESGFGRGRGPRRGRRGGGGSGVGAGALIKVAPVEFMVRDADGEQYSIKVRDPQAEAIRGILSAAIGIAAVAILISLLSGFVRRD
jgi:uncharacterized spore protein YtfJ